MSLTHEQRVLAGYAAALLRHSARLPAMRRSVIDWLETNHPLDPFFLWVDMWDPHEPFDPPWYDHKLYANPDYDGESVQIEIPKGHYVPVFAIT